MYRLPANFANRRWSVRRASRSYVTINVLSMRWMPWGYVVCVRVGLRFLQVVDERVEWETSLAICTDVFHHHLVVELVAVTDTSKVVTMEREVIIKEIFYLYCMVNIFMRKILGSVFYKGPWIQWMMYCIDSAFQPVLAATCRTPLYSYVLLVNADHLTNHFKWSHTFVYGGGLRVCIHNYIWSLRRLGKWILTLQLL